MKRMLLFMLLMPPIFCSASDIQLLQIPEDSVVARRDLGKAKLLHMDGKFGVVNNNVLFDIHNHNISPDLRDISQEDLGDLLSRGYIKLDRKANHEYTLESHGRLNGGGYYTSRFVYWAVKSVAWGTVGAAAGGVIVSTAPAAIGGSLVLETGATYAATQAGAGYGAGVVYGLLTKLGLTSVATTATGGTMATSGVMLTACIETAAVGASTWAFFVPWLP